MSKSVKISVTVFLCLALSIPVVGSDKAGTEIDFGKNATHVAQIKDDTLVVVSGNTYSYTVDTPEGKGLVSTGIGVQELPHQIRSKNGSVQEYRIFSADGTAKTQGEIETGDQLIVTAEDGSQESYFIDVRSMALSGELSLEQDSVTVNTSRDFTLNYSVGQRTPDATVRIHLPEGVNVTMENTTVNVIGRGSVKLKNLETQSIGRVGAGYPHTKVGTVEISKTASGGSTLTFRGLDLRPDNGIDLQIVIRNVNLSKVGRYSFKANYTTSKPEVLTSAGTGRESATFTAVETISDFRRILDNDLQYKETAHTYTSLHFKWTLAKNASDIVLMQSNDKGKTWERSSVSVDPGNSTTKISGLAPNKFYTFRLAVEGGENSGYSNLVQFYSGKMDIKQFGVTGSGKQDDTQKINEAIDYLNQIGGGTLLFSKGMYNVRTAHLKSNVWLYVDKGATIKALKGADAPEPTWFSDKKYRSGLSPTDTGPYENPENWLTKQDVGHTYFRNSMFFGERISNVKIIGNGRITGDGNLVTTDGVMDKDPDNRADKMFSCKLCTNIEIGGIHRTEDLWYDLGKDKPYYIREDGSKDFNVDNMLNIDQGGHFVLLATGCDSVYIHDTYFAKHDMSNARDIYDFMGTSNVIVTNIYSKVSSDDIVKLGSDVSLGYTQPAHNFKIRNVIGDTNCNLFQIGSETADDITVVHVDNIYVLGANKAGFSISTNDGALVKDIHLNCGHTGKIYSRSKMYRTRTPFFVSISNRGRILGAEVGRYQFQENGRDHDEILVENVNIGRVENVILKGVNIYEVYRGSSYRHKDVRWKPYDGSQDKATPIVAGYKLPDSESVEGGLDFRLPNGKHTGYIKNIVFRDVHVLAKGGNPPTDTTKVPPELGVGQYNVSNLKVQPSYGLWARHVKGLTVKQSTFNYEKRDSRYALFLDDVVGAQLSDIKMVKARDNDHVIKLKNSSDIAIENAVYYHDEWGKNPTKLSPVQAAGDNLVGFPQ